MHKKTAAFRPRAGIGNIAQPKRKTRRRWFPQILRLALFSLPGLALVCAMLAFIVHADIFRVTDLQLTGLHTLSERQVLNLAGLHQGLNLVTIDPDVMEKKIEAHPWIAKARVKKRWPSGVLVQVEEYKPFALLNRVQTPGERPELYYIDYQGRLIAEAEGGTLDFPVISGVGPEDVASDSQTLCGQAAEALQLLHLAARGNALLPLQSVSEMRVLPGRGVALYLADEPFPIFFSSGRLQKKFNNLLQVLKDLYKKDEIHRLAALEIGYGDDDNKLLCRLAPAAKTAAE